MEKGKKKRMFFFSVFLSIMAFTACTDNVDIDNQVLNPRDNVVTRSESDTIQYFTVCSYLYGEDITYYPSTIPSDNRAVVRIQFNRTNLRYPGDHAGIIEGRTFTFKYLPVGTSIGFSTFTAKVSIKGTDAVLVDIDSKINYALVEVYLPNAFEHPEFVTGSSTWPVYVYDDMGRFIGDENDLPKIRYDGRK